MPNIDWISVFVDCWNSVRLLVFFLFFYIPFLQSSWKIKHHHFKLFRLVCIHNKMFEVSNSSCATYTLYIYGWTFQFGCRAGEWMDGWLVGWINELDNILWMHIYGFCYFNVLHGINPYIKYILNGIFSVYILFAMCMLIDFLGQANVRVCVCVSCSISKFICFFVVVVCFSFENISFSPYFVYVRSNDVPIHFIYFKMNFVSFISIFVSIKQKSVVIWNHSIFKRKFSQLYFSITWVIHFRYFLFNFSLEAFCRIVLHFNWRFDWLKCKCFDEFHRRHRDAALFRIDLFISTTIFIISNEWERETAYGECEN